MYIRKVTHRFVSAKTKKMRTLYGLEMYDGLLLGWNYIYNRHRAMDAFTSKDELNEWIRIFKAVSKEKVKECKPTRR